MDDYRSPSSDGRVTGVTLTLAAKLAAANRHVAWERTGAETCIAALACDAARLAFPLPLILSLSRTDPSKTERVPVSM